MTKDDVYFPGEKEQVLERIAKAVTENPVSVQELLTAMELLATLANHGASPVQIVQEWRDRALIASDE